MINSIKFRMGSGLSIPIYADWIKVNSLNLNEDRLVISAVNGLPTNIAIAFEELPVGFIIFASNNVGFSSVEQDLEHVHNAMEFDLYRRSMKIGFADLIQLHDLDNWRYLNGIPVELQLSVKILEDEDGFNGFTITAKDEVASMLMKKIQNVAGDDYSISASDNVETGHAISNRANLGIEHGVADHLPIHAVDQTLSDEKNNSLVLSGGAVETSPAVGLLSTYQTGMHFENDVQLSRLLDLGDIDNGMIHITGNDQNLISFANALQDINGGVFVNEDELDLAVGVSILQNNNGDVCLVLRPQDELEIDADKIPCRGITVPSNTMLFEDEGQTAQIVYALSPGNTTDSVTITSSDTNVVQIQNGIATAVGIGDAQITITCGEQVATIDATVQFIMHRAFKNGWGLRGWSTSSGNYVIEGSNSQYPNRFAYCGSATTWGDGRYITKSSSPYLAPYKLPANCNRITVTVPGGDTQNSRWHYNVLFFDSTMEGKNGDSGYAYWLSSQPTPEPAGSMQNATFEVDQNADSFAIGYWSLDEDIVQSVLDEYDVILSHASPQE